MNIRSVALLLLIFIQGCSIQRNSVCKLKVINENVKIIVDSVYKSERPFRVNIDCRDVFVMRIKDEGKRQKVRIAVINKANVITVVQNKKDKLLGYFTHSNIPVIVYGDNIEGYFIKTSDYKTFDFMKTVDKKDIVKENKIPPPPPIVFEPNVWYFILSKDTIKLEHVGLRVTLLE